MKNQGRLVNLKRGNQGKLGAQQVRTRVSMGVVWLTPISLRRYRQDSK